MTKFGIPSASLDNKLRSGIGRLAVAFAFVLVAAGCGDYDGPSTDSSIAANTIGGGLPSGLSVAEQVTSFETTVYPVLRTYCDNCHDQNGPGAPKIAHASASTAWSAVVDNQKVNFSDPPSSRLVRRLSSDLHHCWSDCTADAAEMLAQIVAWQAAIEAAGGTSGGVDVAELTSSTSSPPRMGARKSAPSATTTASSRAGTSRRRRAIRPSIPVVSPRRWTSSSRGPS